LKHKGKEVTAVLFHSSSTEDDTASAPAETLQLPDPAAVKAIQKSIKFQSLFDQFGLNQHAQKAATEALSGISAQNGSQCFTAETHAKGCAAQAV